MLDQAELLMRPAAASRPAGRFSTLYAQPEFDAGNVLPLETRPANCSTASTTIPITRSTSPSEDGEIVGSFALLVMHNLGHLGRRRRSSRTVVVAPASAGRRASARP